MTDNPQADPPTATAELASLAVNAGRAVADEKRHYEIACQENARLRAVVERVRNLHDNLDSETDLASPGDSITRGAAARKIAAALDGYTPPPVQPAAADRAAILRELASSIQSGDVPFNTEAAEAALKNGGPFALIAYVQLAVGEHLRRMADEAQQPEKRQACHCGQDGCEYCDVDDDADEAEDEEPTEEQIVREHVTTVHLIGEQLADVESWLWKRLAEVRAEQPAAVSQPGKEA